MSKKQKLLKDGLIELAKYSFINSICFLGSSSLVENIYLNKIHLLIIVDSTFEEINNEVFKKFENLNLYIKKRSWLISNKLTVSHFKIISNGADIVFDKTGDLSALIYKINKSIGPLSLLNNERMNIPIKLVKKLILEQFPEYKNESITILNNQGWCNSAFKLSHNKLIKLPRAVRYAQAPRKEFSILPYLSNYLPLKIPTPIHFATPNTNYPHNWLIYNWIDGDTAEKTILDKNKAAID